MAHERTVIRGRHYRSGQPIEVVVEDGKLKRIDEWEGAGDSLSQQPLPLIGPGLVDLQLNGYQGMDFNADSITPEVVHSVTRALWKEGVTSYYPTVITNSAAFIEQAVSAIACACEEDPLTAACIAGIHLEGPFISPEDGARGAHPKAHVTAPDWELLQRWQDAAGGRIRIVTLSPEWPEAPAFIRRCVEQGIVVSIGHTAASPEQIRAAAEAGASMSTHFGNGAHPVLPRHPNYLWEQLACNELWSCVIADGFHLPDAVLKVVLKVKEEQMLLVSDAVHLSGMPPGAYETPVGGRVVLTESGRLHLADDPRLLAGSAQMLLWSIAHMVGRGLCSLADAWEMASVRPAAKVGLQAANGLEFGAPADLLLMEWDGSKAIPVEVYKSGASMYTTKRQG
ncbi:N-acetylglucosamine-6-phosphate deacetylase [Paenibacillus cremeus]|uniref:Amidohydrolase family protein n=1 Tax=Paenibacillus cremeus TaxID=2163881 RepID=A0A559K7M0_9BACL|nr:amidohydrolase family protein [Paenibacillus cremeus]TVY08114.1 amidohydrolase family protein [Paenibacillus cremeus]